MQIYHFDPSSGELLGSDSARVLPGRDGYADGDVSKFQIPAFATIISPPTVAQGYAAAFIGGAWQSIVDHRGETWFAGHGVPIVVDFLGDPTQRGLAQTEPEAPTPDPGTVPPSIVASALSIQISGGDISSMAGVFNIGAGLYLGAGQYMLFFLTPQPDADYFAQVTGDAPCLRIVDRQPEYLMIEARDGTAGDLIDAGTISVQAFRF